METKSNLADLLGNWLDGHRKWPCQNPHCGKRVVDPDSPFQYCSVQCMNAVKSGKTPNKDRYKQATVKLQAEQRYWMNQVHHLDRGLWR